MAAQKDRLTFRLFHFFEGTAEGGSAIFAFVVVALAVLVACLVIPRLFP